MFLFSTFRRAYGAWFHILNLIVYAIFLALLTTLVTTCPFRFVDLPTPVSNSTTTTYSTDRGITVESCEVYFYFFRHNVTNTPVIFTASVGHANIISFFLHTKMDCGYLLEQPKSRTHFNLDPLYYTKVELDRV